MELANTCNEGDKSGAKCFVQLRVRCELTQEVKWRVGWGGWGGRVVDNRRGAALGFTAAFSW